VRAVLASWPPSSVRDRAEATLLGARFRTSVRAHFVAAAGRADAGGGLRLARGEALETALDGALADAGAEAVLSIAQPSSRRAPYLPPSRATLEAWLSEASPASSPLVGESEFHFLAQRYVLDMVAPAAAVGADAEWDAASATVATVGVLVVGLAARYGLVRLGRRGVQTLRGGEG
jgi:hypothetical protein